MKSVAKFFIENAKLTVILSLFLIVFGKIGLDNMNSESFPAVNFAMAIVTTSYDGASAEDIETKITKPIEDEIRTVTGLKDVRSVSQAGLSQIFIRADIDNIDVDEVMNDLQKAVDRVSDLPNDLKDPPKYQEINSQEFPVIELAIIGSNKNRLRDLAAENIQEEIEDHKSVLNVRKTGHTPRQFLIRLNKEKLESLHIGINEVMQKVQLRNINIPGGNLKKSGMQKLVRIEGKIKNALDLGNILIRSNLSGQKIYLKDLAEIVDGSEDPKVLTRYNGEEATLLIITKKSGADIITLVNDLESKLNYFKERYKGQLEFKVFHDEAVKVENKLNVLFNNAIGGLVLVLVFLFIFLPGRIGLMAGISLPLAVFATIGAMPLMGMNLNAITILALVIALGMLVDNSVVITENYTRLRQEGLTPKMAIIDSIDQLWGPITATALTTIAAFLPMLVTKGIMGEFIKHIPIVVSLSLLISLIESFFFLPMRLVKGGGTVSLVNRKDWFKKFENAFLKFIHKCVKIRYVVAVGFIIVISVSFLLMFKFNSFILFPADQTEIYVARFETPRGSQLTKTHEAGKILSKEVMRVLGKDADHIVARAGVSKTTPTDPKAMDGDNIGLLMIYVSEYAKQNRPHTEVLEQLRTIKGNYLSSLSFEAIVNGPPVGNAIQATFRSNSSADLDGLLEKMMARLGSVSGIKDLRIDNTQGDDEVHLMIDYTKADQLGLDTQNIGNTIRTAVQGKVISTVTLDNKDVDIHLQLMSPYRQNKMDLQKVKIMDKMGNLIPISTFAKFENRTGSYHIRRFDFKRSKTLTGNVNENVITAFNANKILKKTYEDVHKEHPSVSLVFGGQQESTKESMDSLKDALILSLIGIFALLVFMFKSYLRPGIIMTTIPLGLLGFSVAFYLHQRPISFLSLIGIIGLGGIIVNSGIVLISFIESLRVEHPNWTLNQVLSKASAMRLRAVLVTSLTTISGLLPTAYGIGGTDAILVPMTLAMAWGLTSGTILTLVWVPCAYAILEDIGQFFNRIFGSKYDNNDDSYEEYSQPVH